MTLYKVKDKARVVVRATLDHARLQFASEEVKRLTVKKEMGGDYTPSEIVFLPEDESNLVSSLTVDGFHAPAIDIDMPCALVPSITKGHYHLYIDKKLTWEQYLSLLQVMTEVGIVEEGYFKAAKEQGMTLLRKPSDIIKALFAAEDGPDSST